ncbi:MAG: PA domain-containing protein [Verrucomicrobiota bacterium]
MKKKYMQAAITGFSLILIGHSCFGASFSFTYLDAPGFGFNDTTPVSPIGGNNGITLGEQRRNLLEEAANRWALFLQSDIEIEVEAQFEALPCTAISGALASAGPVAVEKDFPNAPINDTWYVSSLANALSGADQFPSENDIIVNVNINVDADPACLLSLGFYYGLDNEPGLQIDLFNVLLHELGHGLGFLTLVDNDTFNFLEGTPDAFARNMFDLETDKSWVDMTALERSVSATNDPNLVWTGEFSKAGSRSIIKSQPILKILTPSNIAGSYDTRLAEFGPPFPPGGLEGEVVLVNDGVGVLSDGCEAPFVNANELVGRIALIDWATCLSLDKVKNAQDAGAIAVIVANTVSNPLLRTMLGIDPEITIPSAFVSLDDGNTLKANLSHLFVRISETPDRIGTNESLVRLHAPSSFQAGSSISHWSTNIFPNLLMEAALPLNLRPDLDLTLTAFKEIGWPLNEIPFPHQSYTTFVNESFPSGASLTSPADNPDGDDKTNLEEYAYGSNPLVADSSDNAISLSVLASNSGLLTYERNRLATDIDFSLGISSDLASFVEAISGTDFLQTNVQQLSNSVEELTVEVDLSAPQSFYEIGLELDPAP